MQKLASIKSHIDAGLFLRGLALAGLVYILLFFVIWLQGDKTLERLEQRLSSQTVLIERDTDVPLATVLSDETHEDPDEAEDYTLENAAAEDNSHESDSTEGKTQLAAGKNAALSLAPIAGLYEETEDGILPVINKKSGVTPFDAYKCPYVGSRKPVIALLVDDYGLSDTAAETIIKTLPAPVTLLLSPYSNAPDVWQEKARGSGHEIWMDLPFENADYPAADPGSRVLLTTASLKHNEDNITWGLSRTTGYAGISARTDYVFDGAGAMLQPLMKFTFGRGLGYIELNPGASDVIETLAITANAPYAKVDVHINEGVHESSPYKKLEFIAREKGYAIGVLKPHSSSLSAVAKWLETLDKKGIGLVPVSAIAGRGVKEKPQATSVTSTEDETPEEPAPASPHNDHH